MEVTALATSAMVKPSPVRSAATCAAQMGTGAPTTMYPIPNRTAESQGRRREVRPSPSTAVKGVQPVSALQGAGVAGPVAGTGRA
jgi:hypothetical protein